MTPIDIAYGIIIAMVALSILPTLFFLLIWGIIYFVGLIIKTGKRIWNQDGLDINTTIENDELERF
jgi:hypothetical protein